MVAHDAGGARGLLLKLADAIEAEAEDFATLEALNCGKPRIRVLQDEMPAIVDLLPLLRRRRARHARRGGGRISAGPHVA